MPFTGATVADKSARSIRNMHERYGRGVVVVVVIDEYDCPPLDTVREPEIRRTVREDLREFYGVLKSFSAHLRIVLITGITKYAHVSVFSTLNHLNDESLNPSYADMSGWTVTAARNPPCGAFDRAARCVQDVFTVGSSAAPRGCRMVGERQDRVSIRCGTGLLAGRPPPMGQGAGNALSHKPHLRVCANGGGWRTDCGTESGSGISPHLGV